MKKYLLGLLPLLVLFSACQKNMGQLSPLNQNIVANSSHALDGTIPFTLNKTIDTIFYHGTDTLVASIPDPHPGGVDRAFVSADTTIARVNRFGVIRGWGLGTTTIYAYTPGRKDTTSCKVTVRPEPTIFTKKGKPIPLLPGMTDLFRSPFLTSGTPAITWVSSDTSVLKVDQTGLVTAVKVGTATITYTAKSPFIYQIAIWPVDVVDIVNTVTGKLSYDLEPVVIGNHLHYVEHISFSATNDSPTSYLYFTSFTYYTSTNVPHVKDLDPPTFNVERHRTRTRFMGNGNLSLVEPEKPNSITYWNATAEFHVIINATVENYHMALTQNSCVVTKVN